MRPFKTDDTRQIRFYILFAALCGFATAVTTVLIHHFNVRVASFEESIMLYRDSSYLRQNWIIMLHCFLVLCSMLGMAILISRWSPPLAVLGFTFFVLFVFSEWHRTIETLWHINGMRRQYVETMDEAMKGLLRFAIRNRINASNTDFLLFTIGITLGNASYGTALLSKGGLTRILGAGLLAWSACTSCAFIIDFIPNAPMQSIVDNSNKYFQPAIRISIATWLFTQYNKIKTGNLQEATVSVT